MACCKNISLLAMLLIVLTSLRGQEDAFSGSSSINIRPLDQLLTEAIQYSPVLKMQNLNVEILYSDLKLLKKEWANYMSMSASFQVGNVQFIDNLSGTGGQPDVRTVTRENVFAVAGVSIRLPLSDFLTKAERQRQVKLEIEQQKFSMQQRELEIRQLVIRQYNDVMRSLSRVEIRTEDLNFHQVTTEMAERYFTEGNLGLEEYTTAFNKKNEAAIRLEDAKLDAQLSLLLLREVVGKEVTF